MLHITNGDVAAGRLSRVFAAPVLPWRDVLHEGPARAGLSLEALSAERARFIADAGWGSFQDVLARFRARDAVLQDSRIHEEVVLWFEHDLYDQLQLIQLLDWFRDHPHPRLSLVCEAEYVSEMAPERMRDLLASRKGVSGRITEEGAAAWAAFRSPDPSRIPAATGLPFLGAALRRHLQEFPWTSDGLSRLERAVLDALGSGDLDFPALFEAVKEEPRYLGDVVLRWHLGRMEEEGLIERRKGAWSARSRRRKKRVPRWLGGVLVDERCPWRWDAGLQRITK